MAIFNFNGFTVDSDSSAEDIAQATQAGGVEISGSIVMGNTYGVSGGTHHGTVHGTEQKDS
ncbi:hypothetical protein ACFT25_40505 [Streptomyces hydrogenans]|uniref:hypothetical protein n=1 Tax=Streptomyces hydrogenans TaxID=1873719 RepID=UPI0036452DCB